MKNLNPVIPGRVSDELYRKSIGAINARPNLYGTNWTWNQFVIHMIDSVSRGYTTPMEAYDALDYGVATEALKARESAYSHLL